MFLNSWSHVVLRFSFENFDFLYFLQATRMDVVRFGKVGKSRRNVGVENQEGKYLPMRIHVAYALSIAW